MSRPEHSRVLFPLVALLTVTGMLATAALTALPVVAPLAARTYGIPASWIGYQFSLVAGSMALSLLFLSNAAPRWGGTRVIQAGLLLIAAALVLMSFPRPVAVVAGSAAMGVGYGLIAPSIAHLLMRFAPSTSRNLIFSIQQTGVPLGSMIAASAGPALSLAIGWQSAFVVLTSTILALAFLMQAGRSRWDDDRNAAAPVARDPLAGITIVLKSARLWRMSISGLCFSGAQFCLVTYTVLALVEQLDYGLVVAGMVLTVSQAAGVGFRLYCGWLADSWQDSIKVLALIAAALLGVGLASFALNESWTFWGVCLLFAGFGFATLGWPGVFFAEVGRLSPPGAVSNGTAGVLLFTNVGKMLTPLAFAAIQSATGSYSMALGSLGLLGAIGLVALVAAKRAAD